MHPKEMILHSLTSLDDISASNWNACANPGWILRNGKAEAENPENTPPHPFNPFISHEFLASLEQSGCVSIQTGWQPLHLVLGEDTNNPIAVMPCYAKSHSQGEYVFDHAWADAYARAGGHYYPKLQASVPFTPATGRRLLTRPHTKLSEHEQQQNLARGLMALTGQIGASSAHITFMTLQENQAMKRLGFLGRSDIQFHWLNEGYENYDDFLASLNARKRKSLRRERREAIANDITIEWISGDAIDEQHWDSFFTFYCDTGSRKWGRPYLTRDFFSEIGEKLRHHILLILAKRQEQYIAGALNLIGSDCLYGRHWGCTEYHPFLHFELCYYQAIDFALTHKLARVEAGAQGGHKLARGYRPVQTHSAHYIANENFREAVAHYLKQERRAVNEENDALAQFLPFKMT